jgi:hypothetical protein
MAAKVLDELDALVVLLLPELQMPVLTCCYHKVLPEKSRELLADEEDTNSLCGHYMGYRVPVHE